MQNLSKWYYLNLFISRRLMSSVINNEIKTGTNLNKHILKFWCSPNANKYFHHLSHNDIHKIFRKHRIICYSMSQSEISKKINEISKKLYSSLQDNKSSDDKSSNQSSQSNKKPPDGKDQIRGLLKVLITLLFLYLAVLSPAMKATVTTQKAPPFISWNEFVHHMLAVGEVQELIVNPDHDNVTIVLHNDAVINGKRSESRYYLMIVADATRLEEKVREAERAFGIKPGHGVSITYDRQNDLLPLLLIGGLSIAALIYMTRSGNIALPKDLFRGMTRAKYTLVDPLTGDGRGVKFKDVAGLKEAKIEVMEFVDYLKNPKRYEILGAKVPKGALLLGPPGCGKTMLAKAVATEASVPFLSMNGSEFIEMIGGLGAARVRDLFKEARKRSPSILYIDEIDAIGKKRSGTSGGNLGGETNSESEQTLNQLLVEMDGIATKTGVIVLASTNRSEVLDKALLRPGRFDRHILIDLPTLPERKEIFEQHLRNIVLENKPETYSPRLAQLTPGFSGADIANICNEAALHAARVSKKRVDANDLSYAIDRVLCGPEKKSHGVSPIEKRIVAYHEAGHALVAWLLEHTDALLKVTIKPTTRGALGFAQYLPTERKNFSKEQLFEIMCTLLGGRAAENIIFNQVTTGAQNDLDKVTKTAYAKIRQFGMSEKVGLVSFSEEETGQHTKKPYSRKLANLMDAEARHMVAMAYQAAEKLLKDHRDKLELVAETLLKQETLTYEEVEKLIGPPPFGQKKKVDFIDVEVPMAGESVQLETQTPPSPSKDSKDS